MMEIFISVPAALRTPLTHSSFCFSFAPYLVESHGCCEAWTWCLCRDTSNSHWSNIYFSFGSLTWHPDSPKERPNKAAKAYSIIWRRFERRYETIHFRQSLSNKEEPRIRRPRSLRSSWWLAGYSDKWPGWCVVSLAYQQQLLTFWFFSCNWSTLLWNQVRSTTTSCVLVRV